MLLFAGATLAVTKSAMPAEWPCYGADAARCGATPEKLRFPLTEEWRYDPAQPPQPAWPEPGREMHRLDFDYAPQPVIASGLVVFGSSANDTIRALDAASGRLQWWFTTDGPLRFAPHVVEDDVTDICPPQTQCFDWCDENAFCSWIQAKHRECLFVFLSAGLCQKDQ